MTLSLRWLVIPALFAGWLCAASPAQAAKDAFTVHDEAKLFSEEAVKKANERIAEIKRETGKDLLIETLAAVPEEDRDKVEKKGSERNGYFVRYAQDRYKERGVKGVYVLICKKPGFVEIYSDVKGFELNDRLRVKKLLIEHLDKKEFDKALTTTVREVENRLERAPSKTENKRSGGGATTTPQRHERSWTSSIGSWICIGLVVVLVIWVVIALIRAFTGGGGGGGGGGYGGGGGGGGFGGFFPSLLGGMFGAAAGMWMYDSFFRSPTPPMDPGGGAAYGGTTDSPVDAGGDGGDWNSGEDAGSGGDDGGGDWGGGDDAGGGDGGDWGGGGDDGGGGGDW